MIIQDLPWYDHGFHKDESHVCQTQFLSTTGMKKEMLGWAEGGETAFRPPRTPSL